MIHSTARAAQAILKTLRKRSMTAMQLLDHLCPPPKFTTQQIQDTLRVLLEQERIRVASNRKIVVVKK